MAKTTYSIFYALLSIFVASCCLAQDSHILDKIVVTSDRKPSSLHSLRENYSVQTFTASDIKQENSNSLIDLLDYSSGVDLRYRGTFGIQGDLSVHGSTFEQAVILIDGVRAADPQTGHHNLDIPLTIFDIGRIEVIKEGMTSIYGAGALAGCVNIVSAEPTKKVLNIRNLFGEHALFGNAFSFSLPSKTLSSRFSFEHNVAKAATPNTDFEYSTASFYLKRDYENLDLDTLFGFQKKDFGADSFYSNLFPEEEEHTETVFIRTGLNHKLDSGLLKNNIYFRKHRDKFILNRNNPTSVNHHKTYSYGLNSQWDLPFEHADLLLGIDTGSDQIISTNLGRHVRLYESSSIGLIPRLNDNLTADIRFRLDHYQKWGLQKSYNFGLGYFIIDKRLKINGSVARAFRIPTFTELYYSDAGNKGNPNLSIEESDNFRLGLDLTDRIVSLSIDGFLRCGHNLIDWTRSSNTETWTATNLGSINFSGIEFVFKLEPKVNFDSAKLEKIIFSYNYMDFDRKAKGFFSKYALDILKHQFILGINSFIFGINFHWQLSYNQRYLGETYFIGNLYLGKQIKGKNFILEPFVKVDNFSNAKYSEVQGVLQPERWIKSGFKFEW
jgi:vitamin B12 transporter